MDELIEPGTVADLTLGVPGPEEELPEGDADVDEPTLIHDDEDEEDLDG